MEELDSQQGTNVIQIVPTSRYTREEYLQRVQTAEKSAYSQAQIDGLYAPEGKKLAITEGEIREILKQEIPPIFVANLQKIVFKEGKKVLEEGELEVDAKCFPKYSKDKNFESSQIEIYLEPYVDVELDDKANVVHGLIIQRMLRHEIGHHIDYQLPLEYTSKWDKVVQIDPREITWYVTYAGEKRPEWKTLEDFAESLERYLRHPGFLRFVSPERFRYMKNLITDHMPVRMWNGFSEQQEQKIEEFEKERKENHWTTQDILRIFGGIQPNIKDEG